ncbi:hypothetical protein VTI28DRAFT_553 [Corynascus sepedonium]
MRCLHPSSPAQRFSVIQPRVLDCSSSFPIPRRHGINNHDAARHPPKSMFSLDQIGKHRRLSSCPAMTSILSSGIGRSDTTNTAVAKNGDRGSIPHRHRPTKCWKTHSHEYQRNVGSNGAQNGAK